MTESSEAALLHKRAVLWLLDQLLREGIVPYTPVAPGDGADATIRYTDGTYRDVIVRPSRQEHSPLAFEVVALEPRPRLLVVCVALGLEPVQMWVMPSQDFARHAIAAGTPPRSTSNPWRPTAPASLGRPSAAIATPGVC